MLWLFGPPMGVLGAGVSTVWLGFLVDSFPTVLLALLILGTALMVSLFMPLGLGIRWAEQATMPFQRRRAVAIALVIFIFGAGVNLLVAWAVLRFCMPLGWLFTTN